MGDNEMGPDLVDDRVCKGTAPDVWQTSVHCLRKLEGDSRREMLLLWAEPYATGPEKGITVRGTILSPPKFPSAIVEIKAHCTDGKHLSLSNGVLTVAEEWRRRGIAGLALARLVRWAQHYHYRATVQRYNIGHLHQRDQEWIQPFYERFGFKWDIANRSDGRWFSNEFPVSDLSLHVVPETTPTADALLAAFKDMHGDRVKAQLELQRLTDKVSKRSQSNLWTRFLWAINPQ